MSLDIQIQVNPGGSLPTIKKVEEGLSAAEKKAAELSKAMGNVGGSFAKVAETIQNRHNAALARAHELHEQLSAQASPLAQGFARIAAAIEREKAAFDALRAPAQQAYQEVQALNGLLMKGAISAGEFNQALAKIRAPSQISGGSAGHGIDISSAIGGLPGGGIVAGALGGGMAGAASAGLQTAVGAAGQVIEMADAYTGLNNRLVALTGSQSKATELFDKLHASADKTRSDINMTASSFVQFSRATRDLGVNQNQVLSFTEHLNEAIALSGADSAAAQAGLMQLSQAMASGALRGQDLHSVMEQIPIVAQTIQDHLHVTAGKFKEMADNGEITAKVVFDAFNDAGPKLEKQFGESIPTIGQQFQVLKNDIGVTVGELMKDANASKAAADLIGNLKAAIEAAKASTAGWGAELHELGISFGDLGTGGMTGLRMLQDSFTDSMGSSDSFYEKMQKSQQTFYDEQQVINRVVAEGTGHLNEYSQSMVEQTLQTQVGAEAAKAFRDAIDRATGKTDSWRGSVDGLNTRLTSLVNEGGKVFLDFLTDTNASLDRVVHAMDPWFDAHERQLTISDRISTSLIEGHYLWDKLTEKLKKNATAANELEKEYKRLGIALLGGDTVADKAIRQAAADAAAFRTAVEADAQAEIDAENRAQKYATEAMDAKLKSEKEWRDLVNKYTGEAEQKDAEAAKKKMAQAEQVKEAWANAAGTIAADLVNALAKGNLSIDQLMQKAAILMLQMAAMKIGGPGGAFLSAFAGGLGGGANGFDYVANSNRLQLPGFATGGDFTVGGSGGTDSKIAMFRVTPGESVHVRTPAQQQMSGTSSAAPVHVTNVVHVQSDPREITSAMGSSSGQREYVKLQRKFNQRH